MDSTAPETFAVSDRLVGYVPGSKQFHRILRFELPRLQGLDDARAFAFLKETFLIDRDQLLRPRTAASPPPSGSEARFIEAMCMLARQLLIDAGLPAFDRETLLTLPAPDATGNRYVQMMIPVVENVPPQVYRMAYQAAFDLICGFDGSSPAREDSKARADALEKPLIEAIRVACASGPNCIHLLKAAFERGVQINHLGNSYYRLGTGSAGVLCTRSLTQGDAAIGARTVVDKWTTLAWLRQNGVPIPRSSMVGSIEGAQTAAEAFGYPVVVKPADRDRGEGVTVDVGDETDLKRAYENARTWSDRIMVEERVAGICHRLVTFQHRFVFAFSRHPKAIVGDGKRTARQLISDAEDARGKIVAHKAPKPYPLDAASIECLAAQGLAPDDVPAVDRIATLRPLNTSADGGYHEVITDTVHPDNVELAERISRMFRLESMGLDLISTDPSRAWHETGARITEVNVMPEIGTNSAKAYVKGLFGEGNGAVPVHCFVGDTEAMAAAELFRDDLALSGVATALTSHDRTIAASGTPVRIDGDTTLQYRVRALQNDPLTESLVVVIQTDEVLFLGRPMLAVTTVSRINDRLTSIQKSDEIQIDIRDVEAVIELLEDGIETGK